MNVHKTIFIILYLPRDPQYIYVVPTEKLRLAWPTFECIRFSHFSRHFGSRYTTHWALFNLTRGRYYLLNTPKKNQLFWLFPSFKIQIECFSNKSGCFRHIEENLFLTTYVLVCGTLAKQWDEPLKTMYGVVPFPEQNTIHCYNILWMSFFAL